MMNLWVCRQIAPSLFWVRMRLCRLAWVDTTAVEIAVAWITLLCGAQIGREEALFEIFPQAYHHLSAVAPENLWASLLLMLGSVQGTCLLVGSKRGRRFGLMLLSILWSALAGLFWTAIPHGLLPSIVTVIAVSTAWAYVRLGR